VGLAHAARSCIRRCRLPAGFESFLEPATERSIQGVSEKPASVPSGSAQVPAQWGHCVGEPAGEIELVSSCHAGRLLMAHRAPGPSRDSCDAASSVSVGPSSGCSAPARFRSAPGGAKPASLSSLPGCAGRLHWPCGREFGEVQIFRSSPLVPPFFRPFGRRSDGRSSERTLLAPESHTTHHRVARSQSWGVKR